MRRLLALPIGLAMLLGATLWQDSRAEQPADPAPPCRFTLESAPATTGPGGHKVENWVLTCHRLPRVANGATSLGGSGSPVLRIQQPTEPKVPTG